ncbi:hypothetical protein NLG97_g255 [Lecanicillium saksenae]|uniref:Uncharacterized protein n=1 Tax=Lecanicillium saksenae TaxID=468837 RepID=A0ACC1RBB2_9HYPO|nr:hypothetical protein NLG97_g255 [Lecanicillium saksenae]
MMAFNRVDAGRETTDDEGLTARNPKRQRLNHNTFKERSVKLAFSHDDYTIGWVCALPKEMAAATAMLDNKHEALSGAEADKNTYTLGSIATHNIVIACLPSGHYGNNNAATVASNMRRTFPRLRLCLMVGIGGGAPGRADIRLGDVVVSQGVLQYDLGKTVNDGRFARTGSITKPPQELLTAVSKLQADHGLAASQIPSILTEMLERYPNMAPYAHRDSLQDRLFDSSYDHVSSETALTDNCECCDTYKLVTRPPRGSFSPRIHYGIIASGNQVMKHGKSRDELAAQMDALCFEMEGAGMMDGFPGLVIRGICDYSDSHKNKQWQEVAAAVAAAYTKELLSVIPPDRSRQPPTSPSVLTGDNTKALDQYEELLDCLKFDQIDDRRANIRAKYSTTCQWLLTDPKYLDWLDPDKATEHKGFLWIRGGPGTGKSTIMNFLLKESAKDEQKTTISFFFNARGETLERSIHGMYRSLLYQLLSNLPELLRVFEKPEYRKTLEQLQATSQGPEGSPLQLEVLQELLRGVLKTHGSTPLAIFVDALDECPVEQVEELIEYFEDVGQNAALIGARLTICFSSRYYPQIDIQYGHKIDLEDQEGHEKDIAMFIRNKLKVGTGKSATEVKAGVQAKAKGIFMWVVLVVDILKDEYRNGRIFDVKKRLAELPVELSELFKEILSRHQTNLGDLRLCIQWILFAKRPLKLEEYYFAVVSGLNPDALQELDSEEITAVEMGRFVVSSSKGLAEVTKGKKRTVQFIHESVREFWLKDGLKELWPTLSATEFESTSHSELKNCCDVYFKFSVDSGNTVRNFPEPLPIGLSDEAKRLRDAVVTKHPFLDYATRFLLSHANAAATLKPQQQFLASFNFGDWVLLFSILEKYEPRRPSFNPSLLYTLAEGNFAHLIKEMLHLNRRIDIKGGLFTYPLIIAVFYGHQDAVEALLGTETGPATDEHLAQPDRGLELRSSQGETALSWAAAKGHEALVNLLIERGSCIEAKDHRGRTPLMHAALRDRSGTVKMLLDKGANHLATCKSGKTALHHAILSTNLEAVSVLLEKENPGVTVLKYWELLGRMTKTSIEKVIQVARMLIESPAHGTTIKKHVDVALINAIHLGEHKIVRLLVGKGWNLNYALDGSTLLHGAARDRDMDLVQALIEFGADIAAIDGCGNTALFNAIEAGHEGIVRLLVDAGADVNVVAANGDTAIALAQRLGILHFLW